MSIVTSLCCPRCDRPVPAAAWQPDTECPHGCGEWLLRDCRGISAEVLRLIGGDPYTEDCPGHAEPLEDQCAGCAAIEDSYWSSVP